MVTKHEQKRKYNTKVYDPYGKRSFIGPNQLQVWAKLPLLELVSLSLSIALRPATPDIRQMQDTRGARVPRLSRAIRSEEFFRQICIPGRQLRLAVEFDTAIGSKTTLFDCQH